MQRLEEDKREKPAQKRANSTDKKIKLFDLMKKNTYKQSLSPAFFAVSKTAFYEEFRSGEKGKAGTKESERHR